MQFEKLKNWKNTHPSCLYQVYYFSWYKPKQLDKKQAFISLSFGGVGGYCNSIGPVIRLHQLITHT